MKRGRREPPPSNNDVSKNPRARRGRPPIHSITPDLLARTFRLALFGLTNAELSERLGISGSTFDRWMREEPEFTDTVRQGREDADSSVAHSLYTRANWAVVKEDKAFQDPKTGVITKVTLTKDLPPSEVACMMWLSNRHPDKWRWRSNVDVTNSDGSFANFAAALRSTGQTFEGEYRTLEQRRIAHATNGQSKAAA